jgi:PAS domain S-box-containing protein
MVDENKTAQPSVSSQPTSKPEPQEAQEDRVSAAEERPSRDAPDQDQGWRALRLEAVHTETIDLDGLLTQGLSDTGSFDVRSGIWATTFGKVIQSLPIPAFLTDRSHNIVSANEASVKIIPEYESVMGTPFRNLFPHPPSSQRVQTVLEDVFATRTPRVHEAIMEIHKQRVWARMTLRSVRIGQDRYILLLIEDLTREKKQSQLNERLRRELEERVAERTSQLVKINERLRDEIEERVKTEQALESEKERFHRLVEGIPFALALIGREGDFKYINPKFTELFGYDSNDIPAGKAWMRKAYPNREYRKEVISAWLEDIRRAQPGETRPRVFTVTCKDETKKIVHFRTVQLNTGDDLMTCEDITERKQAEEALRISEERFRAVFESAQDGVSLKDRELRYAHVNPAMARLLGVSEYAMIGRTDEDIFGAETGKLLATGDHRSLAGQTVESIHSLELHGSLLTLHSVKTPLWDAQGRIIGNCTITRDVTELKDVVQVEPVKLSGYRSRTMQSTLKQAKLAAQTESIVLLQGESGTGKDCLAKYIHDHSDRAKGPFFKLNCAAISSELAESELFGHEKGAFTGAATRKRGLLELAEGGTLLLNEIGELSLPLQAKLLTFLDTKKITRVGGEKEIAVDTRLMAATNKILVHEVEAGRFRKDLFYRLNVMSIVTPPLRDRREDIPVILDQVLAQLQTELGLTGLPKISPANMEKLQRYEWPGNIREFRNVIERAVVLSGGGPLDVLGHDPKLDYQSLPADSSLTISVSVDASLQVATDQFTRAMCVEALKRAGDNRTLAARMLGISRDTLYRYIAKYQIETGD